MWRKQVSTEMLRYVPPREEEFLAVSSNAAKKWIAGGQQEIFADVYSYAEQELKLADRHKMTKVWDYKTRSLVDKMVTELESGDVIVLPTSEGGLWDCCWDPESSDVVTDLGDIAQMDYQERLSFRIDTEVHPGVPVFPEYSNGSSLRSVARKWIEGTMKSDSVAGSIKFLLSKMDLKTANAKLIKAEEHPNCYVITASHEARGSKSNIFHLTDSTDKTMSDTGSGVLLDDHLNGVGDTAYELAKQLDFPEEIQADMRLAGKLHDIGKAYSKFQSSLIVDEFLADAVLAGDEPMIAKSTHAGQVEWHTEEGWRHELASLALIESSKDALSEANDPDLVKHLVATHHGHGRALPVVQSVDYSETISYQQDGVEMTADSNYASNPMMALESVERFWKTIRQIRTLGTSLARNSVPAS